MLCINCLDTSDQMSLVMRKPAFCICENKDADQLRGNREADQRLCFATRIVKYLYFLNPKFQASSHLLWLYSLVCVGPGRKPRRPVFSQRGSKYVSELENLSLDCPTKQGQTKPYCPNAEASYSLECLIKKKRDILLSLFAKEQRHCTAWAVVQLICTFVFIPPAFMPRGI